MLGARSSTQRSPHTSCEQLLRKMALERALMQVRGELEVVLEGEIVQMSLQLMGVGSSCTSITAAGLSIHHVANYTYSAFPQEGASVPSCGKLQARSTSIHPLLLIDSIHCVTASSTSAAHPHFKAA